MKTIYLYRRGPRRRRLILARFLTLDEARAAYRHVLSTSDQPCYYIEGAP